MMSAGLKVQRMSAEMAKAVQKADKAQVAEDKTAAKLASEALQQFTKAADVSKLSAGKASFKASLFGDVKKPLASRADALAAALGGPVTDVKYNMLAKLVESKAWKHDEVVSVFAKLIQGGSDIISNPKFRSLLDRDGNLLTNQIIREANGKIAYDSVADADINDEEAFWAAIDNSEHRSTILENASIALVKNARKLGIDGSEQTDIA